MELGLATRCSGDYVVVQVDGEVDIATTGQLRTCLLDSLHQQEGRLIVDLCNVPFMDCGGVNMLLSAQREALALGGEVRLAAPQPRVCRLLALTGLYLQLPPFPTVRAATEARTAGIPDWISS